MTRKSFWGLIVVLCFLGACAKKEDMGCFVGAFLGDTPTAEKMGGFQTDYGKKPAWVLSFLDWGKFPDAKAVNDVYGAGGAWIVTWEPWDAVRKKGIDYDALIDGKDDAYLRNFASRLRAIGKPVFLRFAHEMNGNWYPWSGEKIGWAKYQRLFRHVWEVFKAEGVSNVRWVFSINAENVPKGNTYSLCYPGNRYVDYIGLDGYNWGTTQPWSRWRSFKDIFFRDLS